MPLLDAIRGHDGGPGRPRKKPDMLIVERCFNRLKQWRALAARYAKRAALYRSSLLLIAALIWLK